MRWLGITFVWLENIAHPEELKRIRQYTGIRGDSRSLLWGLIRTLMISAAKLVIIPFHDILELGAEARINCPSETFGNWRWRWNKKKYRHQKGLKKFIKMANLYGRNTIS